MIVYLDKVISPSFAEAHEALRHDAFTHYWLKGGRGSTKSSFISIEIILGIIKNKNANAVVMRKVANDMRNNVYAQMQWAIDVLGLTDHFVSFTSPLCIMHKRTKQKIIFKGLDDPRKSKGIKFSRGYCKYIWYEEVDEFGGMEEIRMVNQTLMRGGEDFVVFYSYNPPKSQRNWVNAEVELQKTRGDSFVHHSTYLNVPKEWLGEAFLTEAKHLKKVNEDKYNHEYLGDVIGTGGEVFRYLNLRTITDEEINSFDKINRGLDFGYVSDPLHYTENYYDKTRRRLYIFFELHKVALSNREAVELIKRQNKENRTVIADNEPRTINEFRNLGLNIVKAKKGPDSRHHGIKWLEDLEEIIIDPVRCPNTAREFTSFELETDRNGNFKGDYPDKNDHSIDSTRYALEEYSRGTGGGITFPKHRRLY